MGFFERLKERQNRVETVEVPTHRTGLRLAIALGFLAIGMVAIGMGLFSLLKDESGWQKIEISDTDLAVKDELVFNYCVGAGDISTTVELKSVTSIYTEAAENAYKLFHSTETFDGIMNLASLSENVNREVEVDPLLYDALKLLSDEDVRLHYLAPLYREYESICIAENEIYASRRDPLLDDEAKAFFDEVIDFVSKPDNIEIKLLDDSKVMLCISEEYLEFASKNDIESFVDLYWLRNAFVVDAVADTLIENGYTCGNITSYDGFVRNLDSSDNSYGINFFDRNDDVIYSAATVNYQGAASFAVFRDYPMSYLDAFRYYSYSDGRTVTPYVTFPDGLSVSGIQDLMVASKTKSCAYISIKSFPCFTSAILDTTMLDSLLSDDIASVWNEDDIVYYNSDSFAALPSNDEGNMKYKTQKY